MTGRGPDSAVNASIVHPARVCVGTVPLSADTLTGSMCAPSSGRGTPPRPSSSSSSLRGSSAAEHRSHKPGGRRFESGPRYLTFVRIRRTNVRHRIPCLARGPASLVVGRRPSAKRPSRCCRRVGVRAGDILRRAHPWVFGGEFFRRTDISHTKVSPGLSSRTPFLSESRTCSPEQAKSRRCSQLTNPSPLKGDDR